MEVSGVILVNVNRPLSGCSGIVLFVRGIGGRGNLGVSVQGVALSAYNIIPHVCSLVGRGLRVALAVSLRTPGSAVHDGAVPMGSG